MQWHLRFRMVRISKVFLLEKGTILIYDIGIELI